MLTHTTYHNNNSNEVVLIIHGLLGANDNWSTLAKKLQQHYTVYTLNLPNHNNSMHSTIMTYNYMADLLKQWISKNINHTEVKKIILIGHSMGGKITMNFVCRFPQIISLPIIIDIAPVKYINTEKYQHILKTMKDLDLNNMTTLRQVRTEIAKHIHDNMDQVIIIKNLFYTKDGKLAWKINIDNIVKNLDQICDFDCSNHQYDHNIHLLYGTESPYLNENNLNIMKNMFKNLTIHPLNKCGHLPHIDDFNQFNSVINSILK